MKFFWPLVACMAVIIASGFLKGRRCGVWCNVLISAGALQLYCHPVHFLRFHACVRNDYCAVS